MGGPGMTGFCDLGPQIDLGHMRLCPKGYGDSTTWTNLAEQDLPDFGDVPYCIGLVVCSGNQRSLTKGAFEALAIS